MIATILGIIGTLLGVVLGFLLNERSTNRKQKQQSQVSRTIVSLEMDLNLATLQEFWTQVNTVEETGAAPDARKHKLAHNFIELPPPTWSREVLNSQLQFLPIALNEQEVEHVFQFYDHLRRLEAIRSELSAAMAIQREELRAATKGSAGGGIGRVLSYSPPSPFNEKYAQSWDECESLVTQLFAEGNPLKQNKQGSGAKQKRS